MNNNILDLGYEALLRPLRRKNVRSNNAAVSAAEIQAAGIKFFQLEKMIQQFQKTK